MVQHGNYVVVERVSVKGCEFTHEFDLLNYDYDIETKLSEVSQMNVDFYFVFESTLALTARHAQDQVIYVVKSN